MAAICVCKSQSHSRDWQIRRLLISSTSMGLLFELLAIMMVGNRQCSLGTLTHTDAETQSALGLFATQHGMAAYIQWQRIPEKPLIVINKISYNIQKCQRIDPIPSEYPNSTANILKYMRTLTNKPSTSNIHTFSGIYQNLVLKMH